MDTVGIQKVECRSGNGRVWVVRHKFSVKGTLFYCSGVRLQNEEREATAAPVSAIVQSYQNSLPGLVFEACTTSWA